MPIKHNPTAKPQPPISFRWRHHNPGVEFPRRVWRTDWFGDQFEIMGESDFAQLEIVALRFGFLVKQAADD